MKFTITILLLGAFSLCKGQPVSVTGTKSNTTNSLSQENAGDDENGIIYFSLDNGNTWENKSNGLPGNIFLTDIAVSDDFLGVATKQDGIFIYNFENKAWINLPVHSQINYNIDALFFYNKKVFAGTQNGGIFIYDDREKIWTSHNTGLGTLTIRKLASFDNKLYAGTNGGLFSLNEKENKWELEYGNALQVNGITELEGDIYIGTNNGVYKNSNTPKDWKQIMPNRSLHNISSDNTTVYAMTYSELFASDDKGKTWQSVQTGLPAQLYSFQVMKKDNTVLVAQWDGVYKREASDNLFHSYNEWKFSSKGLPGKIAVKEMKIYKNIIVIGCSERKLRKGVTTTR